MATDNSIMDAHEPYYKSNMIHFDLGKGTPMPQCLGLRTRIYALSTYS